MHPHLFLGIKLGPERLKLTAFCNLFPLFKTRDFDSVPLGVLTLESTFLAPSDAADECLFAAGLFYLFCVHSSLSPGFIKGRVCICVLALWILLRKEG